MRLHLVCAMVVFASLFIVAGCGSPLKRPPANVFPGSEEYSKRIADFKISPDKAYKLAHEQAKKENRLQFLSRKPTVVVKRWYVFSMPQASGASLDGYHVNGDTGEVKFVNNDKTVPHTKR